VHRGWRMCADTMTFIEILVFTFIVTCKVTLIMLALWLLILAVFVAVNF